LHILRNLKAAQVTEAIEEGFEKNSRSQMAALSDRLKKFSSLFSDVAEGDEIQMTYIPNRGTSVSCKCAENGTGAGKDFADGCFAVGSGANRVQEDLRRAVVAGG